MESEEKIGNGKIVDKETDKTKPYWIDIENPNGSITRITCTNEIMRSGIQPVPKKMTLTRDEYDAMNMEFQLMKEENIKLKEEIKKLRES